MQIPVLIYSQVDDRFKPKYMAVIDIEKKKVISKLTHTMISDGAYWMGASSRIRFSYCLQQSSEVIYKNSIANRNHQRKSSGSLTDILD